MPGGSDDSAARAEEAGALEAIYGDSFTADGAALQFHLPFGDSPRAVVVRALLPSDYPSCSGPLLEVEPPPSLAASAAARLSDAARKAEQLFRPGDVCLFDCVEWLREQLAACAAEASAQADEAAAATLAAAPADSCSSEDGEDDAELAALPETTERSSVCHGVCGGASHADTEVMQRVRSLIVSGEPLTERKSTFQAHVAPVTDVDQVRAVVAVLLENSKIRHATHNIMAYRIEAPGRPGSFLADCDDDGEAAAGGRLLHLLQAADARNVVVVVSRWFGGVLLGPSRFALINNTARRALEACEYVRPGGGGGGAGGRKAAKNRSGTTG